MLLNDQQLEELRACDATSVPNRLKKAMELLDVTHVQVAQGVGTSQPNLTDISNGKYSRLPLETARRLATYFGCTIEDLFPAREAVA